MFKSTTSCLVSKFVYLKMNNVELFFVEWCLGLIFTLIVWPLKFLYLFIKCPSIIRDILRRRIHETSFIVLVSAFDAYLFQDRCFSRFSIHFFLIGRRRYFLIGSNISFSGLFHKLLERTHTSPFSLHIMNTHFSLCCSLFQTFPTVERF